MIRGLFSIVTGVAAVGVGYYLLPPPGKVFVLHYIIPGGLVLVGLINIIGGAVEIRQQ